MHLRSASYLVLLSVMTAHFPMWVFFSQLSAKLLLVPPALPYLPAKSFMDRRGGLNVVLLRDERSVETPDRGKGKHVQCILEDFTHRAAPCQRVYVLTDTAGL